MKTQLELLESVETYVQENSLKCKLFIYPKTDLSQIAVLDEDNKICLLQEKSTEDFFKEKAGILNLRFHKTYLVVFPKTVSLIPTDLDEDNIYSPFNSESFYTSIIDKQQCIADFSLPDDQKFWLSILRDAEFIPSVKVLINYLTDLKIKYKTILGLNFYNDFFEVVLLENNNLKFYNQFPSSNADEFNFFILTLFEKLDLTPALVQFYLWGDIKENDEIFKRLAKYSQNLTFPNHSDNNSGQFNQDQSLNFNFLIEATECE